MEKKTENSTVSYAPEHITEAVEINFTKITTRNKVMVTGSIRKAGSEVGAVSLESGAGDSLITSIKPYSALTGDEIAAVHSAIPGCISEILND